MEEEELKVKDDKWMYMPPDIREFLNLMSPFQIKNFLICLHLYMNNKPLPKNVDKEVLMTFLHVLSFHENRKEQDEEEEYYDEENI